MAQYNADIRIGVTGKAQLNQLEAQLKRTQTQLNKLNKSLQLRTRVQAIRLDTRAANTAIKGLEQRINRLGRTINVNLRVNEREGRKSQSNSGSVFVQNQGSPAAIAAATTAQRQYAKAVTESTKTVQEAFKPSDKLFDLQQKQTDAQDKVTTQLEKQAAAQKRLNQANAGLGDKGKTLKRSQADAQRSLTATTNYLEKYQRELKQAQQEVKRLEDTERRAAKFRADEAARAEREAFNRQRRQNLQFADTGPRVVGGLTFEERLKKVQDQQKKAKGVGRGFAAGGGVAAASLAGSIPVLNEAVTGGLVAGLSGASVAAGALGGALVGLAGATVAVIADTTAFNNQLGLMRRALANTVSTSDELETALAGIRGVSQDFLVPIGDATEQFTKLNAAARASGFTVEEVEEVYRGLAAANVALGGDSQKLQGILLATQQVFSKGKVQAEELRGQIGERLAGAFAKFAESAGMSTSELDKALEKGEVSLEDFVRFAKSLLEEYEEDAKKLADAPENAGTRLKIAMDNLKEAIGPITKDIGNMFTDMAVTALNAFADIARGAQKMPLDIARAQRDAAVDRFRLAEKGDWNFDRVRRTMERAVKNFNKRYAAFNSAGLTPTGKPPGKKGTDKNEPKGGGSTSGPRDTVARTQVELQLEREMLMIEQKRFNLIGQSDQLKDFDLQRSERKKELESELQRIEQSNITAASKLAEKELARAQYATDLQRIKNDEAQAQVELTKSFEEQERELLKAIELESAITDEMKRQVEYKYALAEIDNSELTPDRKDRLKELQGRLNDVRNKNANPMVQYMNQLKEEITDTDAMLVEMAKTIEGELASAMSSAVRGVIDGTQTVQEAFSNMFKNIADAFIDMATRMIAKALILKVLGVLGAGANASTATAPPAPNGTQVYGGQLVNTGMMTASGGGYTGNAPRVGGLDGEGGFLAMVHPQETIVDHYNQARSAMGGASDGFDESNEAVSAALSTSSSNTVAAQQASAIQTAETYFAEGRSTVTFDTYRVGEMDVVTREDAIRIGQQSAREAEANVYKGLRNMPAVRGRAGVGR